MFVSQTEKEEFSIQDRFDSIETVLKMHFEALKNLCLKIVVNNNNSLLPATNIPKHRWNFALKSIYK